MREAVNEGNEGVQYVLAHSLLGEDKETSKEEGLLWLRKSAEKGFPFAQSYLSILLMGKGTPADDKQAFIWAKRAAEQGHAEAQYRLAELYEVGLGVPRDTSESLTWYMCAAEQGNTSALKKLNELIKGGKGIGRDIENGSAGAQYLLGFIYENGKYFNVPQQPNFAAYWFMRAADQHHEKAKIRLAQLNKDNNLKADQ